MTSLKQPLRFGTLFSFKGRTRRLPFAMVACAILILWQLPEPVTTTLLLYNVPVHAAAFKTVLALLACLAWPLACLAARRLHDAGLSGWLGAVYFAHPLLVLLSALPKAYRQIMAAPWIYDSVSWLLVGTTVVLAVLPGNKGENEHGANPRQGNRRAADSF